MLYRDMTPQGQQEYDEWLNSEWHRCATMTSAFEGHAVSFLTTTNGGGAAAVIAFAGSAAYATNWVYVTLALFLAGVVFAGFAIAVGYKRLSWITQSLGADQSSFYMNGITSSEVGENHHKRFDLLDWGQLFAWTSFALFIVGVASSAVTFKAFQDTKAEKEKLEAAKTAIEMKVVPAVVPLCVHAATLKASIKK